MGTTTQKQWTLARHDEIKKRCLKATKRSGTNCNCPDCNFNNHAPADLLDALKEIERLTIAGTCLATALKEAIVAGTYVVRLIEDQRKAGDSPNPFVKADWLGATMHCYAAMSFLNNARKALAEWGVEETSKENKNADSNKNCV